LEDVHTIVIILQNIGSLLTEVHTRKFVKGKLKRKKPSNSFGWGQREGGNTPTSNFK